VHPGVHVDKFFNKLWSKGSWLKTDSAPPFSSLLETSGEAGGGGSFREVT